MSMAIERLLTDRNWAGARKLIEAKLKKTPASHWLITRLGGTYYQEGKYKRALRFSEKAVRLVPTCPLVLWDYARALSMSGQVREALHVLRRLVRRGVDAVAYGECGEGLAWARGLIADCHYLAAWCYTRMGQHRLAQKEMHAHLRMRGPGCRSIYPIRQVRKELAKASVGTMLRLSKP